MPLRRTFRGGTSTSNEEMPRRDAVLSQPGRCPTDTFLFNAPEGTGVPGYRERKCGEPCFLRRSAQSYPLRRTEDAPGAAHGHSDMPARNAKWKTEREIKEPQEDNKSHNMLCWTHRAGKAESGWTCKLKSPINMHTHTLLLLTATYTWTLIR